MIPVQLDLFGNEEWGLGSGALPVESHSPFPTPHSPLPSRLHAAGLPADIPVIVHTNRRVLVSLSVRGALRVHAGYATAPDEVLAAIVRWARPRTRRADRLAAQRVLLEFPVHSHAPPAARPSRRPAVCPGDARLFAQLHELHTLLNRRYFEGQLGRVRMALSARLRRRLGEFRLSADGIHEIVIGRRHLGRDGWKGAIETLAHEMIHQWQAETGRRLGHGAEFKRMWAALQKGMGNGDSPLPTPDSRSAQPADSFLRLFPET
ncbi:MAG: SprT-like domain-containing protein [Gemmatimonadales bacterium]